MFRRAGLPESSPGTGLGAQDFRHVRQRRCQAHLLQEVTRDAAVLGKFNLPLNDRPGERGTKEYPLFLALSTGLCFSSL